MKLENQGANFNLLNEEQQQVFFYKYVERRTLDLATVVAVKKGRKKKGKTVTITNETLEALKKLGLV